MECAVFVLLRLDRFTWHNVKPPPVCPRVRGAFLFRQDAARCSDGPQCVHSFLCRWTAGFPPLIVNNGAMTWVYKHLSQTLLLGVHAPEVELLDRVVIAFNSLRSSPSCASDFQAQRWPRELRRREPRPPVGPARSHVRRRWREWQWQLFVPFRALVDAWRTEKGGLSAAAARCSLRGGPPRSASLFRAL